MIMDILNNAYGLENDPIVDIAMLNGPTGTYMQCGCKLDYSIRHHESL